MKNQSKLFLWAIPPIVIGIFFTSFLWNEYHKIPQTPETNNEALSLWSLTPTTPVYSYFVKDVKIQPKISAEAYSVGDLETGEVLLTKNQTKKFPIASVSKLMTALVSSEIQDKEELINISGQALKTEGGNGNFLLNEKIKVSDILYPLLLESSNDAAEAIARHTGRDIFLKKMNERAMDLGLKNTSFEDPSGLSPKNQSTASDLFKLAKYIKEKNRDLFKITTNKSFKNKKHSWFSNNQFLREEDYVGGKSGYTDEALQTVVSLFDMPLGKESTRPIVITLLSSKDRYRDVENIKKYLNKNIYYGEEKDANASWVKNKLEIPNIEDQDFVKFIFAGDIMLDRGVKNSVIKNFNNDYSKLFEKLDLANLLKKSDIVFANLEGTASDKGIDRKNLYSFRMDPSVIPALAGAGINILSVANNHVGDWGLPAYIDTLSRLKENEIMTTGGGMNSIEAETPVIIEKYGMKIGFLGFSDVGPTWMEAERKNEIEKAGLLLANNPRFDEIIKHASNLVDYLVVSFHWGEEYKPIHNKRQETLAHRAVDNGAKIVIGHHPHVVEDTEVYSRKDCTQSSCVSFIAYSLGNFIFDQKFSAPTMQGMLLNLKLGKTGEMTVRKDTVKLNQVFQPDKIIKGREEKVRFQKVKQ